MQVEVVLTAYLFGWLEVVFDGGLHLMPEVLRLTEVKYGRMTDYGVEKGNPKPSQDRLLGMVYCVQPAHPLPTMLSENTQKKLRLLRNQLLMGVRIPPCIFEKLCDCSPL